MASYVRYFAFSVRGKKKHNGDQVLLDPPEPSWLGGKTWDLALQHNRHWHLSKGERRLALLHIWLSDEHRIAVP